MHLRVCSALMIALASSFAATAAEDPGKGRLLYHPLSAYGWRGGLTVETNFSPVSNGLFSVNEQRWRRNLVKHYIQRDLKRELKQALHDLEFLRPGGFREPSRKVSEWIRDGLVADIDASAYEVKRDCLDEAGIARDAVARMRLRGTPICFSVRKILEQPRFIFSDVVANLKALVVHEHAHHFGELDPQHQIYGFMKRLALNQYGIANGSIRSIDAPRALIDDREIFSGLERQRDFGSLTAAREWSCSGRSLARDFALHESSVRFKIDEFLPDRVTAEFTPGQPIPFLRTKRGLIGQDSRGYSIEIRSLNFDEFYWEAAASQGFAEVPSMGQNYSATYAVEYGHCKWAGLKAISP